MECLRPNQVCDFESDPRPCRKQCVLTYPTIEDALRELYPLPKKAADGSDYLGS